VCSVEDWSLSLLFIQSFSIFDADRNSVQSSHDYLSISDGPELAAVASEHRC